VLFGHGVWERDESEEVRDILRPGDTCIDVGADFGWYSVIGAKAVGPAGRVIAFEPLPQNFEFLKRNGAANECANARIEPLALSCTFRNFLGVMEPG
jgi:predicted methyltransferase